MMKYFKILGIAILYGLAIAILLKFTFNMNVNVNDLIITILVNFTLVRHIDLEEEVKNLKNRLDSEK